ncbi:MAG TPA: hypothetical protein VGG61_06560 [Gemmataceae bacterium]
MTPETAATDLVPKPSPSERRNRTLVELAAAQGISGPQDFGALFGAGADLWDDDADFEAFQAAVRLSRRTVG